ncbi:hypothetical protein ACQR3Z_11495 [Nocardia fluminea]
MDQRKVAGAATTVIVGTVTEQLPSKSRMGEIPETQFKVKVNSALKGDANCDVIVSQQGGFDPKTNTVILIENDPLIEVGSAYVFSTVFDPAVGWYGITPVVGHEEISVEEARRVEIDPNARVPRLPDPPAVSRMRDSIANQVNPYPEE